MNYHKLRANLAFSKSSQCCYRWHDGRIEHESWFSICKSISPSVTPVIAKFSTVNSRTCFLHYIYYLSTSGNPPHSQDRAKTFFGHNMYCVGFGHGE
jgi:hypothetical protein